MIDTRKISNSKIQISKIQKLILTLLNMAGVTMTLFPAYYGTRLKKFDCAINQI